MAPILLLLGLFLCFFGGKLVKPALMVVGIAAGIAIGYWAGTYFNKPEITWIVAGVAALAALILVRTIFSAGLFLLGAVAGGAIYYGVMNALGPQTLPQWGVLGAGAAGGLLAILFQKRVMTVLTALVGGYMIVQAGLLLYGGHIYDMDMAPPAKLGGAMINYIAWIIISVLGIMVQRSKRHPKSGDD